MRRVLIAGCCLMMFGVGCSLLSLDDLTDGRGTTPDLDAATQDGDAAQITDASSTPDGATEDATVDADAAFDVDAEVDAGDASRTYVEEVLADQPMGYWRFEDATGSPIAKATVGTIDATLSGDVDFDEGGAVGRGLHFTNGGVLLGDNFDIVGTMSFAAEFWAKPVVTSEFENVLYKRTGSGGSYNGYAVYFYDDKVDGGYGRYLASEINWSKGKRSCRTKYPADGYLHVVVTYELATGLALYVNGKPASECYTENGGPLDTAEVLAIGGNFTGWIDEVSFYDHGLPQNRILAHYAAGKP